MTANVAVKFGGLLENC